MKIYVVKKPKYTIGDAGSKWRMMKLRRVYEMAEEEGKPVEEIALMRYGVRIKFVKKIYINKKYNFLVL